MSYNLFLDDVRDPKVLNTPFEWVVARNFNQFTTTIQEMGLPDIISFDHDLAEEHYPTSFEDMEKNDVPYNQYKEKTGYHCVLWLIEYCKEHKLKLPSWNIHSMNPVGRINMALALERAESYLSEEE